MEKMTAWVTLSEKCLAKRLFMRASYVLPLLCFDSLVSFISEIYFFELFILFVSMLFGQVSHRTISLTWLIVSTTSLIIVSTLYSTLCHNNGGVSLGLPFSTSVKVIYFTVFLGLTGS